MVQWGYGSQPSRIQGARRLVSYVLVTTGKNLCSSSLCDFRMTIEYVSCRRHSISSYQCLLYLMHMCLIINSVHQEGIVFLIARWYLMYSSLAKEHLCAEHLTWYHQRRGHSFMCSCIHLFKYLYILSYSHTPTLTHPHTHTFTHPHRWQQQLVIRSSY